MSRISIDFLFPQLQVKDAQKLMSSSTPGELFSDIMDKQMVLASQGGDGDSNGAEDASKMPLQTDGDGLDESPCEMSDEAMPQPQLEAMPDSSIIPMTTTAMFAQADPMRAQIEADERWMLSDLGRELLSQDAAVLESVENEAGCTEASLEKPGCGWLRFQTLGQGLNTWFAGKGIGTDTLSPTGQVSSEQAGSQPAVQTLNAGRVNVIPVPVTLPADSVLQKPVEIAAAVPAADPAPTGQVSSEQAGSRPAVQTLNAGRVNVIPVPVTLPADSVLQKPAGTAAAVPTADPAPTGQVSSEQAGSQPAVQTLNAGRVNVIPVPVTLPADSVLQKPAGTAAAVPTADPAPTGQVSSVQAGSRPAVQTMNAERVNVSPVIVPDEKQSVVMNSDQTEGGNRQTVDKPMDVVSSRFPTVQWPSDRQNSLSVQQPVRSSESQLTTEPVIIAPVEQDGTAREPLPNTTETETSAQSGRIAVAGSKAEPVNTANKETLETISRDVDGRIFEQPETASLSDRDREGQSLRGMSLEEISSDVDQGRMIRSSGKGDVNGAKEFVSRAQEAVPASRTSASEMAPDTLPGIQGDEDLSQEIPQSQERRLTSLPDLGKADVDTRIAGEIPAPVVMKAGPAEGSIGNRNGYPQTEPETTGIKLQAINFSKPVSEAEPALPDPAEFLGERMDVRDELADTVKQAVKDMSGNEVRRHAMFSNAPDRVPAPLPGKDPIGVTDLGNKPGMPEQPVAKGNLTDGQRQATVLNDQPVLTNETQGRSSDNARTQSASVLTVDPAGSEGRTNAGNVNRQAGEQTAGDHGRRRLSQEQPAVGKTGHSARVQPTKDSPVTDAGNAERAAGSVKGEPAGRSLTGETPSAQPAFADGEKTKGMDGLSGFGTSRISAVDVKHAVEMSAPSSIPQSVAGNVFQPLPAARDVTGFLDRVERLQDLIARFDEHVLTLSGDKDQSMTIRLVPDNLGKVTLQCRDGQNGFHIEMLVENQTVRNYLQQHEGSIREMLTQAGYQLAQFDVRTQNDGGGSRMASRWQNAPSRKTRAAAPVQGMEEAQAVPYQRSGRGESVWYIA